MVRLSCLIDLLFSVAGKWFGYTGVALGVGLFLCSESLVAQTTFPYVAYVASPQTFVRSGPGQRYYPTHQLETGHAVEVFRRDDEDWCAVRPPEGSYSLISAHDVQQISENVAEVIVEQTVTRVGSQLSSSRSAVQVLLHRGNRVRLLPSQPGDNPRWLRIAPPPGEFRWIANDDLSSTPPVEPTRDVELAGNWARQDSSQSSPEHSDKTERKATPPTEPIGPPPQYAPLKKTQSVRSHASTTAGNGPAWSPPPPQGTEVDEETDTEIVVGSPAAAELSAQSAGDSDTVNQEGVSGSKVVSKASGPTDARISELQIRLSQVIVRPKAEWDFSQLQREAQQIWDETDSVSVREQVETLLERITLFQGLASTDIYAGRGPVTPPEKPKAPGEIEQFTGLSARVRQLADSDLNTSDPFETEKLTTSKPLYDAVGKLKPVVSRKEQAPSYALIDDQGDVISFLTPGPDINLQPYVGRRIGVHGTRGFMPEYRRAHVTASRVTVIK